MIKVENMEAFNFEGAIRGMRNPLNSWDKSDSCQCQADCIDCDGYYQCKNQGEYDYTIGNNDLELAKRLIKAGPSDRKFLRQIFVCMDVTAPLYWWKEADQYKVATVTNSCSTMHKLTAKEFELDDFSHDHLNVYTCSLMEYVVNELNVARKAYLITKNKEIWYQIIQLLPSSYNQRRTWTLDYETLRGIYHSRKDHKLDEWREFCEIIKGLPYAEDLIIN